MYHNSACVVEKDYKVIYFNTIITMRNTINPLKAANILHAYCKASAKQLK